MKLAALGMVVVGFLALPGAPAIAQTRPNVFSIEGLGRGLAYSVGYDRSFGDRWSAGVAFSLWGGKTSSANLGPNTGFTFVGLPAYANFYFLNPTGQNRAYLTVGLAYGNLSGSDPDTGLSGTANGFYAPIGVGYELRAKSGLLLRAAPYVIFSRNTTLWLGFTLGYAAPEFSG